MKNSVGSSQKYQKQKNVYNIQTSQQLKSYLSNENIHSLKSILFFLLSSLKHYQNNISLFYEILSQLIEKINTSNSHQIRYDQADKSILMIFLSDYSGQISIINKQFDNIFSEENVNYYLFSNSKHNITIFLFFILATFSFISFEVEGSKSSKKEIYHTLQRIRSKYICNDMNRILCPGCSLNCMTRTLIFINKFITGKIYNDEKRLIREEEIKNREERMKQLQFLTSRINIIKKGIDQLENWINDEKVQKERVIKELSEFHTFEY